MKMRFCHLFPENRKRRGSRRQSFYPTTPYSQKGIVVRLVYVIFALGWSVLTVFGRFRRNGIIVLCYHGVSAGQRERFAWQMSKIRSRAVSSPQRAAKNVDCVYVTFDDAFANLLDNAIPVLELFRIPAAIFAVAECLGSLPCWEMPVGHPEYNEKIMTTEQLVSLSNKHLIKIGSHTMAHSDLTSIPDEQVKAELVGSKQRLEMLLERPVEELALPYGAYNRAVLAMAKDVGYKRIYTLDPKIVDFEVGNQVLGRFSMSPDVWKIEFMLTCAGMYAWLVPWRRFISRLKGSIGKFRN